MAQVDLMGEIDRAGGAVRFRRGVTTYPTIGDPAEPLTVEEMRTIFDGSGAKSIKVGQLQQDARHRRAHRYQRDAEQAFRHPGHHRGRQIERGRGHPAAAAAGAAGPARAAARRPQRIRPLFRRSRPCGQSRQPAAAVLAVQFRGDHRRVLRRPSRRRRGDRDPLRGDPARQGRLYAIPLLGRAAGGQEARSQEHRLHGRHAGSLPAAGHADDDRRADGKAREPLVADDLSQADHPHRDRSATTPATRSCSRTPMWAATPWRNRSASCSACRPTASR